MATGYDIVMVGGGLGGATLARVMAAAGKRILVLERTASFQDRVRGEVLVPWGCTEARQLGLFDILHRGCGHELRWWDADLDGRQILHRDLPATTRTRRPILTFYHPDMQRLVLDAAIDAGAEVRRGTVATMVEPGPNPRVSYRGEGGTEVTSARLVVGADGRGSALRKWGGFSVRSDPQRRFFAGVLMDDLPAPEDTLYSRFRPSEGLISWIFPQGGGRVRTYIGYHAASIHERLQGAGDIPRFIETSVHIGVPEDYFANARIAGPLATFDGTDNWVDHPYQNGIALIGDAAATSDPTWGQGMSLTLRDVRLLTEALLRDDDWNAAGHAYAGEHDRGYAACHTCDNWYTDLFLEIGPEADETGVAAHLHELQPDATGQPLIAVARVDDRVPGIRRECPGVPQGEAHVTDNLPGLVHGHHGAQPPIDHTRADDGRIVERRIGVAFPVAALETAHEHVRVPGGQRSDEHLVVHASAGVRTRVRAGATPPRASIVS